MSSENTENQNEQEEVLVASPAKTDEKFIEAESLLEKIESTVIELKMTYIEATLKVCDDIGLDIQHLGENNLVSPKLRSHLMVEGVESGLLKSSAMLVL